MTTLIPKFQQLYSNSVNRAINFKLAEFVSVLDFGAVADGNTATGTGTDNTTFFQNAINSLGSIGSLYIPAGVYKVSSQITVPSGITILGAGPYVAIIFCPNAFNSDGLIKFNGSGGPPTTIQNVAILAQNGGAGTSSIGLNMAANGSLGSNLWIGGFATQCTLNSSSVFLYDSVMDEGISSSAGVTVNYNNTVVSNVEIYYNYQGLVVQNISGNSGTVSINNIQVIQCPYTAFAISSASNVQLTNCAIVSSINSFSYAGLYIVNSTNIDVTNLLGTLVTKQTTGNGGVYIYNSSYVNITSSQLTNFYNGINISSGSEIIINGNICSNNYNIGIYAAGTDRLIISNNNCNNDGGGTSDAGIYSNNSTAYAIHNITGNICTQNGSGVQNYGIYANLTNNGSASGFTNIVGNVCKYNNTANISSNGLTGNITQTGNVS